MARVCERRACVLHVIVACLLQALTSVWQGGKKMAGLFMKLMQQHAVLQQGAA